MSKNFKDLADRAKAGWSDDGRSVYAAAAVSFDAELNARAELGHLLTEARKASHLTQPALSDVSGIQQSEISRIERGVSNPTASTLNKIAAALGQKIVLQPLH